MSDLLRVFGSEGPSNPELTRKISPLLHTVRDNHINCYHQLLDDFCPSEQIFLPNSARSPKSKQTITSINTVRSKQLHSQSPTQKNKNPTDKTEKKVPNIANIKRHLVQTIDIAQIEQALYRGPLNMNRFQELCLRLQKRASKQLQSSEKSQFASTETVWRPQKSGVQRMGSTHHTFRADNKQRSSTVDRNASLQKSAQVRNSLRTQPMRRRRVLVFDELPPMPKFTISPPRKKFFSREGATSREAGRSSPIFIQVD